MADTMEQRIEDLKAEIDRWRRQCVKEQGRAFYYAAQLEELKAEDERYVIWSHEHSAWWRPARAGYCRDVCGAGVYSREEALSISHKGRDGWFRGELPDEIPVRVADLPEYARDALASVEATNE